MSDVERPQQTPGDILRAARESAGISAREMADRLNWMPGYISAIEENRYEEMRGIAFVRGYLRTYGKMLGVPEQSLLFALDAMVLPEPDDTTDTTADTADSLWKRPGVGIALGVGAALLLLLLFGWEQGDSQAPPVAVPAAVPKEYGSEPIVTREPSQTSAQAQPVVVESTPVESTAVDSTPAEIMTVDAAPVEEIPVEAIPVDLVAFEDSPVEAAPEPLAFEDAVLQFTFSGDCWLEVRDGEDTLVYADLHQGGDELGLDGLPPFNILLGNAAGVQLVYRGEDFAIPRRPGRTTARFNVGTP